MPVTSSGFLIALSHPAGESVHHAAGAVWTAWTFEPLVVGLLAASAVLYAVGVRRLWAVAGASCGLSRRQVWAFAAGWLALAAALVSPVDAIGAELFSVHMVQHELLMIVAAPLLVFGSPLLGFLWTLSPSARRNTMKALRQPALVSVWTAITAPAVVWILHAVALWTWHVPALYEAALRDDTIHALEHACFFLTACLFWWGITRGRYGRLGYGSAVLYVFATAMHSGLLGAALTLSPGVWYPGQTDAAAWGLAPIEDQQLAGLVMWVPAGLIFVGMGLLFFAAWLNESGRRARYGAVPPQGAMRRSSIVPMALLLIAVPLCSSCRRDVYAEASALTGGDPDRGRAVVSKYGCDTCHVIPGIRSARGRVGPPLAGVATRVYLAGHVPNTPGNMQDWIRHPHRHDAQTVMPETGVTEQDARDIAAYLYMLR